MPFTPAEVEIGAIVERPRSTQIQVAMTSFLALFSIVGFALYGLPFYYNHMVKEFGWSTAVVTSGNAISKAVMGPVFGFCAGWIIDRFGPRRLMMAGILMAGTAVIGLSAMTGLWMFYLFYFLNAMGYVCGGPLPNQVLLARWFYKSRGKAMGFAYLGIGVGGMIVPLLTAWLTNYFTWRGALRIVGILMIVIALPMAYFVKESPEGASATRSAEPPAQIRGVFRSPWFYLLALGSMCSIGAVGGTNQHLKLFLSRDHHYAEKDAAFIASLILGVSIAGRLLMGWLADRWAKKYVMLLIYLLIASAIPILFFVDRPGAMYLFAIIFGLGLGGEYLIIPLIAGELFGVRVLGRLLGIVLTADGVAEAMSPLLVGYFRDHTGAYRMGFLALILMALIGFVAVSLLPKKPTTSAALS